MDSEQTFWISDGVEFYKNSLGRLGFFGMMPSSTPMKQTNANHLVNLCCCTNVYNIFAVLFDACNIFAIPSNVYNKGIAFLSQTLIFESLHIGNPMS